jgi:hypothetical protein
VWVLVEQENFIFKIRLYNHYYAYYKRIVGYLKTKFAKILIWKAKIICIIKYFAIHLIDMIGG